MELFDFIYYNVTTRDDLIEDRIRFVLSSSGKFISAFRTASARHLLRCRFSSGSKFDGI